MPDTQAREVAVKFAKDAVSLIERGKASDVCARKLVAAATVIHRTLGGHAMIEELLRDEITHLLIKNTQLEAQNAELRDEVRKMNLPVQEEPAQEGNGTTLKP